MNDALQCFAGVFSEATKAITPEYFQLPVAELEDPQYRERVYCYELYHQMRSRWPSDFPFSLSGEVDKNKHPLIRGGKLDRVKPDFLVHVPGIMDMNLLVIEVKPLVLDSQQRISKNFEEKIVTDLEKLTALCRDAKYHAAWYLFYGFALEVQDYLKTLTTLCGGVAKHNSNIDFGRITLLIHARPGISAVRQPW